MNSIKKVNGKYPIYRIADSYSASWFTKDVRPNEWIQLHNSKTNDSRNYTVCGLDAEFLGYADSLGIDHLISLFPLPIKVTMRECYDFNDDSQVGEYFAIKERRINEVK